MIWERENEELTGIKPHHLLKSSHSCGSSGVKPTSSSSFTNIIERSLPVHHQSSTHHRQQNVNHALLSRVPRHSYNVQHSHKNIANYAGTSTSHGKASLRDDKHSWKFGHKSESGFGYFAGRRDKASRRMDRIRSNPLAVIDSNSPNLMNNLCRLCQQRMRDNSVVAVLVCGHIYHADCLEIRTSNEDKRDPPCPLCIPLHIDN
uniref:uncharacterized protein LOC122600622 isoform X2 n=1 Tax=Erigeron canadensis TaxID=72917 RepID=UPI001CB94D58|nr:uncharacterized protein LOC122600622 isoform X2 [Erigeron canadensis]